MTTLAPCCGLVVMIVWPEGREVAMLGVYVALAAFLALTGWLTWRIGRG